MKLLVAAARPFVHYDEKYDTWHPAPEIPYRDIEATLKALNKVPRQFEVHVLMSASLEKLSTTLLHGEYDGLHLICHGTVNKDTEDGHLLFEDQENSARLVDGKEFFDALSGTDVRLLTLSACHGQAAIQDHIPSDMTVLAVNPAHSVYVCSAHTFFDAFYSLLLKGRTASEAFGHAEKKPGLDGLVGDDVPEDLFRLLSDNGGSFAADSGKANISWLEETPTHWVDTELPALGTFVGRAKEIFELVHALSPAPVGIRIEKAPIVVLHSSGGTGKTTLARKVCQRLHEDRRFQGGIYELAALGKTSGPALADKLFKALGSKILKEEFSAQLLALYELIPARSNGRETLFFLDNMEEAFRPENPDKQNVFKLLTALVQAHDGVRVLATSQMESGVSDKKLVKHIRLADFFEEETEAYLAKRIELFEEEPEEQQLQEYKNLFHELHALTGGHPLSLFLITSQFDQFLRDEGDKLDALKALVSQLEKDFVGTLQSEDPSLAKRHLSIEECLQFTLSLLDEDARELFLHLCLFPAGATWKIPDFLKKFIGFQGIAYRQMHETSLVKISGEKPTRRFLFIQPALRQTGETLLLNKQPKKKKQLLSLYRKWIKGLRPGVNAGKAITLELDNCTLLLHEAKLQAGIPLYNAITNHIRFIPSSDGLASLGQTYSNYLLSNSEKKQSDDTWAIYAKALNSLGIILANIGRRKIALTTIQEAVRIRRYLADTNRNIFLPDLAESLNSLGVRLSDLGKREEALSAAQESVEIRRNLAEKKPTIFLPHLASSLGNLGNRFFDLGNREEALTATQESVEIETLFAKEKPDAFLPDLAASLNNLGVMLFQLGRRKEALQATHKATDAYRHLAGINPKTFLPYLAASLNNLGSRLVDLGRPKDALTAAQESLDIRKHLAQKSPEVFLSDLASSFIILGKVHFELEHHTEAYALTLNAVNINRNLATVSPDTFLHDLALNLNNLGVMLIKLHRHEEALNAAHECTDIYRRLVKKFPDAFISHLAINLNNLGGMLFELKKYEEALCTTEEAIETYRIVARRYPDAYLSELAMCLSNAGSMFAILGRVEDARTNMLEAWNILLPFYKQESEVFRQRMEKILGNIQMHCPELAKELMEREDAKEEK